MGKTLYVGGTFDDSNGKESKIANQVFDGLNFRNIDYFNGGNFSLLENLVDDVGNYDLAFWFPNVSNSKLKLVKKLKKKNKKLLLVTSKLNSREESLPQNYKYGFGDLIYRALSNKSNLLVEIKNSDLKYSSRVVDPLGNVFLDDCEDFKKTGKVLRKRMDDLLSYSRISSTQVGEVIPGEGNEEFFDLIKEYANVFHDLIHPPSKAVNRFMGNASFRCERGFPSYREEGLIYVSKRNVDKRFLDENNFVAVKQELPVLYYGDDKPSVDTPIQIGLYKYYSKVNYMIHSHTYVVGAPFTASIIPCGSLEEVGEITAVYPDNKLDNFSINLRGHGSIVFSNEVSKLNKINYEARPAPEFHLEKYSK